MDFLGQRIQLNPRPAQQNNGAFEVGMLGHCPGRVRIERLLALGDAVADIRAQGYGPRLDALVAADEQLYHLPIPLHSLAEFEDIFPDARSAATVYGSLLAEDRAWLVSSVEDFFANGGEKIWVVQVPEEDGIPGFLPDFNTPLYEVEGLMGIATLLAINSIALIAMPDLERLQIPAHLSDIPRNRLANPKPQFLPCTSSFDDGHRERRHSSEMPEATEPQPLIHLLQRLLGFTKKHRPDIQCLLTLPLVFSEVLGSPDIDDEALSQINQVRQSSSAYLLRQIQFLFPYLRSPAYSLRSPVGVVTGLIANSASRRGPWRSVAGLAMATTGRPYPEMNTIKKVGLRESPGVGVITYRGGKTHLDDERITVPALYRHDYLPSDNSEALMGLRSAEVVRFLGFLLRQLRALGERLIFNVDYRDPRPLLALENFFRGLYQQGALRGRLPEDAFAIRQSAAQEGVVAYDIQIAPAFPIDKIELTFVNRQGQWRSEVSNV